ncbi:hypothetical protein PVAP13_2NG292100 [Panicum virgatum]|uniref:Uncharacterized protein n=1 Tax=Panicum virgatum TaxID=38727 RepID=A0A8T0VLH3_PANVG|nr:hypothetical protein PVAP13_2NG292100 [Panicum virgatum]KAG2634466.1 hypothetical protein PVAP13_2NG292100 [Panicum virgatum]
MPTLLLTGASASTLQQSGMAAPARGDSGGSRQLAPIQPSTRVEIDWGQLRGDADPRSGVPVPAGEEPGDGGGAPGDRGGARLGPAGPGGRAPSEGGGAQHDAPNHGGRPRPVGCCRHGAQADPTGVGRAVWWALDRHAGVRCRTEARHHHTEARQHCPGARHRGRKCWRGIEVREDHAREPPRRSRRGRQPPTRVGPGRGLEGGRQGDSSLTSRGSCQWSCRPVNLEGSVLRL